MKVLIKIVSFFLKEFHDVRRQPLLLLSLVGGPLLVLGAFGATFQSANPFISAALVWPEGGIPGVDRAQAESYINSTFHLALSTTDRAEAMAKLDAGDVDLVQIIPDVTVMQPGSGKRPEIEVYSRAIDPTVEAWIRSISYGEMNFINQQLLAQEARVAQTKAQEISVSLDDAKGQLLQLQQALGGPNGLSNQSVDDAVSAAEDMRSTVTLLLNFLPPVTQAQAIAAPELVSLHQDAQLLIDEMDELSSVLRDGDIVSQLERLSSSVDEIDALNSTIAIFVSVPPETITSPVLETYENLRGTPYSMVVFFTPAVLALLIQQLAVTLGALGLVRELQMGAYEMFRVAPLRFAHILIGKSLAYILYVTVAGFILTGVLSFLNVPMPTAHPIQHAALILMLATASVGLGFLISTFSRTDSQAIQLTMLTLLLSIFFTGFFLPIIGFSWPAWIIAIFMPMTHGILGFKDLLLKGEGLTPYDWWTFVYISGLFYGLVGLRMWRQYRKTT